MKSIFRATIASSLLFAAVRFAGAQGTAFTYQGQLTSGGSPATGLFDFRFDVINAPSGGTDLGGTFQTNAVGVTNGLFTVPLDFGAGVFTGAPVWLQITVSSNAANSFYTLSPRQLVTSAPYSIFAATASNLAGNLPVAQLAGSVGNAQLANNSVTINAGPGLVGGGTVALGAATTLSNAGVLSVAGNSDLTAVTTGGAVVLGSDATNANTPSTLVKRDATGSFLATSLTLSGDLNLPFTTPYAGMITLQSVPYIHSYGVENFFAGYSAGNLTMTGTDNVGIGQDTLVSETSGYNNTAIGVFAMNFNTSGSRNTAAGYDALLYNKTGSDNTAVGVGALGDNTNGSYNVALGNSALSGNTSGSASTALGYGALEDNLTGGNNTAVGYQALEVNDTGGNNTAVGIVAMIGNSTGSYNTALGGEALAENYSGSSNTAVGYAALYNNSYGNNNAATGYAALFHNDTGNDNTADGTDALYWNETGSFNTANGYAALYINTNGAYNTANGAYALYWNTTGGYNTADGVNALYNNTTGLNNTADGAYAIGNNLSGYNNIGVGNYALQQLLSGNNNIAIGYQAGSSFSANESGNIDIGNSGVAGENNIIRIGSSQTKVIFPSGSTVYTGSVALTSDRNAKENFTQINSADVLAKVAALPVTVWNYKWDGKEVHHLGPMAQDFQAAFGLDGDDDKHISVVDEGGVALAAIQGLNRKVEEKDNLIRKLGQQNDELASRLQKLESLVKALTETK